MEAQEDYISSCIKTVIQISLFEPTGDILVFLTGQDEIEEVKASLTEKLRPLNLNATEVHDKVVQITSSEDLPFVICPLYAALPASKQMQAFQ